MVWPTPRNGAPPGSGVALRCPPNGTATEHVRVLPAAPISTVHRQFGPAPSRPLGALPVGSSGPTTGGGRSHDGRHRAAGRPVRRSEQHRVFVSARRLPGRGGGAPPRGGGRRAGGRRSGRLPGSLGRGVRELRGRSGTRRGSGGEAGGPGRGTAAAGLVRVVQEAARRRPAGAAPRPSARGRLDRRCRPRLLPGAGGTHPRLHRLRRHVPVEPDPSMAVGGHR